MIKKVKVLRVPFGFKLDKRCGFLAVTGLGLDVRIQWRSEWWNWGFTLGIIGRGICFERDTGFWRYHETLEDFWLA